ncbi:MAG: hypothetical protein HY856_13680 [Burkholderiales bacterium]|nr:hypothetical protein [Burkholderiales bacterium]
MTSPFNAAFEPTESELAAHELARFYHDTAEAFDRTVCTGPIVDGSVRPATPLEAAIIGAHAARLRRQVFEEARARGVDAADLKRAIVRLA